jgi:hypothetical protein
LALDPGNLDAGARENDLGGRRRRRSVMFRQRDDSREFASVEKNLRRWLAHNVAIAVCLPRENEIV